MENMDKEHTVPKWGLIVRPKLPQMPPNISAQFVCPSPNVLNIVEKRLHWASVVRGKEDLVMSVSKSAGRNSNSGMQTKMITVRIQNTVELLNPISFRFPNHIPYFLK